MHFLKYVNSAARLNNVRRYFSRSIHKACTNDKPESTRFNVLGIQMLSESLHKKIFKECYDNKFLNPIDKTKLNDSIKHLSDFGLYGEKTGILPDIDFAIPELVGNNINEHFMNIAEQQSAAYVKSLQNLINGDLPAMPNRSDWLKKPGWTKYTKSNNGYFDTYSVECPDDSALVFDCEVLASFSDVPIIGVAVSNQGWYSWTSEHVLKEKSDLKNKLENLIPLEPSSVLGSLMPKVIVGHNVGYDRARVKEQYFLNPTKVRFFDTMSMHIAVSGFTSQQRNSAKVSTNEEESNPTLESSWVGAGSLNSLNAVHQHYCGSAVDKAVRDTFISGTLEDVKQDFQELMQYCAKDVEATFNVLKKIAPMFFSRFPHPVTFAGMLELGQMYLPTNYNWKRYLHSCQIEYDNLTLELKRTLIDRMNDACHLLHDEKFKEDHWLRDLDWSVKQKKMNTKARKDFVLPDEKKFHLNSYFNRPKNKMYVDDCKSLGKIMEQTGRSFSIIKELYNTSNRLPLVTAHLPGCPQWYKDLQVKEKDSDWSHDSSKLSTLTRATPRLLRLTWLGYSLHHCDKMGWGYLVPAEQDVNGKFTQQNDDDFLTEINDSESWESSSNNSFHTPAEVVDGLPDGYTFHRLPHKNGIGNNVGSPLSHDFIQHIESGLLSSSDHSNARRCLDINKLCSYWRSAQKRIVTQMVIYLDNDDLPDRLKNNEQCNRDIGYGAIVPQVTVCGAVSRRAVERTWLTASNTESNRIGSELKSMIQAPPGYCFVGADVDSQELWIASLLGDSSTLVEHGCTALSWMTLQGNKKDGTDLHSKTAQAIGMTRNEAKIFNYARMYGAGKQAALRNYMQHNPDVPKRECIEKINKLYDMTKGNLLYQLSPDALWIVEKTNVQLSPTAKATTYATYDDINKILKAAYDAFGQSRIISHKHLVQRKKWIGGVESEMFNKMEEIAMSDSPQTPVLKCQISTALHPSKVGTNFLPSRMNWVVQSSAVDYLHLLVVTMRWLIEKYNLDARFVLSIHDEVHYLASEKHQNQVALALQVANLLTRCMFAYQMGMHDLPLSVAFFSAVEIDGVIRKEANDNCVTPSNPGGLERKYGIPLGNSLDIYDILNLTNGSFT